MSEIEAAVCPTDTKPNQYINKDVARVPTLTDCRFSLTKGQILRIFFQTISEHIFPYLKKQ